MRTVQLYGGGIDSLCIAYLHRPDVKVYFHLGTEEADREAYAASGVGCIVDHRFSLGDQVLPNKILPARNLILVAGATYYGNNILLGSTAGDTTKDKDEEFLSLTSKLLGHILVGDVEKTLPWFEDGCLVTAPARHLTKAQLVKEYLRHGGDPIALVEDARSCYHGGETECGICRSCVRKYVALKLNGIEGRFECEPDLLAAVQYAEQRNRGREALEIKECLK